MQSKVKFTVIGDLHYVRDDAHREIFAGRAGYKGEIADLQRYAWARENVFPDMMAAIRRDDRPDAVFVLGDVVQGNCDDPAATRREFDDAQKYLDQIGCPVYIARGNHDDPALFAQIFPGSGSALGQFSYHLRMGGISFLVLDSAEAFTEDCGKNIAKTLAAVKPGERIFVFTHQPVSVVARAFFADQCFLSTAQAWTNIRTVDCWFGGHTHEQIFSLVGPPGRQTLQAITSALGSDNETPTPLEFTRNLLIPPSDYYYGFHENTCPSWLTVTVDDGHVTLSHRTLQGEMGCFEWKTPAEMTFRPSALLQQWRARGSVSAADCRRIRSADLWFGAHDCASAVKQVFLNDAPIGTLSVAGAYAGHSRLPVPPALLKMENRIRITNPSHEPYTIGGLMIRATLEDGKIICSSLSPQIYTYTDKWRVWNLGILERKQNGADITLSLTFGSSVESVGKSG